MKIIKKIIYFIIILTLLFTYSIQNKIYAQFAPLIPIDTLSISTERFTPKEIILISLNLLGDDGIFQVIDSPNNGYITDLLQFNLDSLRLDKAIGGYMPNYGYVGEDLISYEATNSYGSSGEKFIKINIYDPAHPPPSIPDSLTKSADLTQLVEIELISTDIDNDDAIFEITSGPFLGNITNIEQFQNIGNNDRAIITYQSSLMQSDFFTYIAKDNDGTSSTGIALILNGIVGIENNYNSNLLSCYKLHQNYPNPFNPITKIDYNSIPLNDHQTLEIVVYNSVGQEVWDSGNLPSNNNNLSLYFDGSEFNSGIYYYSLILDGKKISTKSMLLIK